MMLEYLRTVEVPPVLYHYTTQSGLLGILGSNHIWATAVGYLNDSTEVLYGYKLIEDRLLLAASESTPPETERLCRIAKSLTEFPTVCVVSLTTEGDLLSQWRGYAGGTAGAAIGFSSAHLRQAADEPKFYLVPCHYRPEDQNAILDLLISHIKEQIRNSPEDNCIAICARVATILKAPAFEEEHEWRLISIPQFVTHLAFRPGTPTLIPYFNFPLGDDRNAYLEHVVVGPSPEPILAVKSVQMLLRKLGLSKPEERVRSSGIPYRKL